MQTAVENIVGSKYFTHVLPRLEEIYKWLCEGMTEYSIADELDIGHNTFIDYKKKYPEIIEVFTRARAQRNALVMNSMFKKSNGETVQIKKAKVLNDGSIVDYKEEQYIPPDVNAADLYLRNNDPDYKGPKAVEITNNTNNNFQLEDWKTKREQILAEIRKLETQSAVDVECFPVKDDCT
jgi:hypothetical protein